ncbi:MAG: beta-propeller domain-containing protein, partial [Eubacteriales bacterium]|nr:beta-propeller domain-containing protein [Eubacteriales bacterium]
SDSFIYIVKAENGRLTLVSKINTAEISGQDDQNGYSYSYAGDIYVTPTRLIVMKNVYSYGIYDKNGDTDYGYTEPVPETDYAGDDAKGSDKTAEAGEAAEAGDADETGNGEYEIKPTDPNTETETETETESTAYYYGYYYNTNRVCADIYDITDKASPEFIASIGQDGYSVTSRMIGGTLYLVSQHYFYGDIDINNPQTFVPSVYTDDTASLITPESITLCPVYDSMTYIIVNGIDTVKAEITSTAASVGSVTSVYANTESLYIAGYAPEYVTEGNTTVYTMKTLVQRYTLEDGKVVFAASGLVNGNVLNQFSMDEYKGYLRMVTTVDSYTYTYNDKSATEAAYNETVSFSNEQSNSVYVLNRELEVVGKIEGLANDERVYSVRFDGDVGYFVTFRQVDPLFTADFTDPRNPKILSALKIPGFSNYLHPFDDGLLFGLGMDADENGSVGYLKLSMFDVSDPADVSEVQKLVVEKVFYSEASYNHKAILIDSKKNLIAFPAENAYYVYSYDSKNGFELKKVINFGDENGEQGYYYWYYNGIRSLYIGDYLYIVISGGYGAVASYDMSDFSQADKLEFTK